LHELSREDSWIAFASGFLQVMGGRRYEEQTNVDRRNRFHFLAAGVSAAGATTVAFAKSQGQSDKLNWHNCSR
jgi:hypothetical protein